MTRSANAATSFAPYDPSLAIGEVSASEALNPTSAAPRGRRNKCGALGAVLVAAVAVAAAVHLAPFVSGIISTALGGATATGAAAAAISIGSGIAGGALAGAAGSIVGQGLAVATGLQDQFSWKGVALAAIGGGVGGGIGGAGILSSAGGGVAGFVQGALRGALGNVLTQGTSMALGLQKRFDFAGLAVAGVAGGVGDVVGGGRTDTWRQIEAGAASAIAGAATRSIATGTSFGDNVLAVLPDVIGATIGRVVGASLAQGERSSKSSSGPYGGLDEMARRYPGGGIMMNAGYQTRQPPAPPQENLQITVIGRRIGDEVSQKANSFLYFIDRLINTNLSGRNPHKRSSDSPPISLQFSAPNFFRPSSNEEIAQAVAGKPLDAPFFNASQPSTVRSWVLQRRFSDNVSGMVSSSFGEGSAFNKYIGIPVADVLSTANRFYFGLGTPTDTYINRPFYSAFDLVAQTPLGNPGVIATMESNALLVPIGTLGAAARSITRLRAGTQLATERAGVATTGEFYSVAFETKLSPTSYPGVSRQAHFQEANGSLLQAMEEDAAFASGMQSLGINLQRTPTGLASRTSPSGWTWHHAKEPGVMQLVPRSQHQPGSRFQGVLHPDGRGGYSIWGK